MKALHFLGITLLSIISCMSIIACSNDNSDKKNDEVVTITPLGNSQRYFDNGLTFTSQSGSENIEFTCNGDWNISVANTIGGETWCTVTPANGKAGEGGFTVNVVENKGYDDRNVTLTLTVGNIKKTIVVTQKQKKAILLTANKFELDNKGGKINLEVKTNINYTVTINETDKKWIKQVGNNTRALSSSTLTFDISPNEEYEKREGVIYITNGELTETVHVYQASGGVVMLTKNEYFISDKKQTIAVDIKSNFNFEVKMPNVDWISIAPSTKSMSSHTLYYIISPNEEYDSRESEIIFYDKSNVKLADTLKIIQAQKDAIIISKKEYEVNSKENTIEFEVNSNIDFNVSIPSAASKWIENITTTQTRGLTSHKVYLKINENTSTYGRSAKVAIKHTQSNVADTVFISQLGVPSLSPSSKTYHTYPKGGEISVSLTTNTNYTVEILGDAKEWITQPQTRNSGFRTDVLSFFISENNGDKRTGEIKIISENEETESIITVEQESYIYPNNLYVSNIDALNRIEEIGYKRIKGNLSISNVDNLQGLKSIQEVDGDLSLSKAEIESFNGLESLQKVGGTLKLDGEDEGFKKITNLEGLNNLRSIGGDLLITGTGECFGNLVNFQGLNNLEAINGSLVLKVTMYKWFNGWNRTYYREADGFNALQNFNGLEQLTSIGKDIILYAGENGKDSSNKNASSFNALTSININKLETINGDFTIYTATSSFGNTEIRLPSLTNVGGNITITSKTCRNIEMVKLKTINGNFICGYPDYLKCNFLEHISGNLECFANSQQNLLGLSGLKSINGNIVIKAEANNTEPITTFNGLNNLSYIGGNFELTFYADNKNPLAITSFEGLNNLEEIGGSFIIRGVSSYMSHAGITNNIYAKLSSFHGLNKLKSIGGNFDINIERIKNNDNLVRLTELKSLDGLEGLTYIGGDLIIKPDPLSHAGVSTIFLENISSLQNLQYVNSIYINYCHNLYDFTPLTTALRNSNGEVVLVKNGYNPTKEQILNGEGKQ